MEDHLKTFPVLGDRVFENWKEECTHGKWENLVQAPWLPEILTCVCCQKCEQTFCQTLRWKLWLAIALVVMTKVLQLSFCLDGWPSSTRFVWRTGPDWPRMMSVSPGRKKLWLLSRQCSSMARQVNPIPASFAWIATMTPAFVMSAAAGCQGPMPRKLASNRTLFSVCLLGEKQEEQWCFLLVFLCVNAVLKTVAIPQSLKLPQERWSFW